MSREAVAKVIQRSISDATFRRQLATDPTGALRGYDLSGDEAAAIRSGDSSRLVALGVEQRMSKVFALAGDAMALDTVSKAAASDLSAGTAAFSTAESSSSNSALATGNSSFSNSALTTSDSSFSSSALSGTANAGTNAALTSGDGTMASAALTSTDGTGASSVLSPGEDRFGGAAFITDDPSGGRGALVTGDPSDGRAALITGDTSDTHGMIVTGNEAGGSGAFIGVENAHAFGDATSTDDLLPTIGYANPGDEAAQQDVLVTDETGGGATSPNDAGDVPNITP